MYWPLIIQLSIYDPGRTIDPVRQRKDEDILREVCDWAGHTSARNKNLLVDRFVRNESLRDLANKYGISEDRVRQIIHKFWFALRFRINCADSYRKYETEAADLSRKLLRIKVHNPKNIMDVIGDNNDRPLTQYGFSINTYCLLAEAGIKTIGQLIQSTDRDILRIHGLGEKSLQQIKKVIAIHGYALKEEQSKEEGMAEAE